jgi:NAD(P)-dependent dehydrogenase (short-subunit alcohol dehydrogenase family)
MPAHVEKIEPDAYSLRGKVAVVTGAAGSIGSAVVARLMAEGVRVVAVDQDRTPDPAAVGVNYLRGDVVHPATAPRAVATAEAAFGGLDLLVNAASSSYPGGLADMDLTCWNRVLAVNLTGTLLVCQAAVPAMRRRGGGVIVNLGGVRPVDGPSERLAYAVSRDAVVALSRHLAIALEPLGIHVRCLHPGTAPDLGGGPDKDVAAAVVRLLSTSAASPAAASGDAHTPTPA